MPNRGAEVKDNNADGSAPTEKFSGWIKADQEELEGTFLCAHLSIQGIRLGDRRGNWLRMEDMTNLWICVVLVLRL